MGNRYRVGILGATGTVGQRFIQLLENHPQFEITALAASDRSQGKSYWHAANWKLPTPMPEKVKAIRVQAIEPNLDCDLVFSSLPSSVAKETEEAFARAGYPVLSNSSSFRMEDDIPLLIPEFNADHLVLIETQRQQRGFRRGFIVTNPNCAVISFAPPLAALDRRFGVESVIVTTMQAISGAGSPGVPSLDIIDNTIPFIGGFRRLRAVQPRSRHRRSHGFGTCEAEKHGDARGRARGDGFFSVARSLLFAETFHLRLRRAGPPAAAL
jgi:aspartate-semialdehyde dehydrogenase